MSYQTFILGADHSDFLVIANGADQSSSANEEWAGIVSAMKDHLEMSTKHIQKAVYKARDYSERKFEWLEDEISSLREDIKSQTEMLQNSKVGKQSERAKNKKRKENLR